MWKSSFWRWLPHRLSKLQSELTTVLRTSLIRTINNLQTKNINVMQFFLIILCCCHDSRLRFGLPFLSLSVKQLLVRTNSIFSYRKWFLKYTLFYKNNFIRTRLKFCPEIKNKLRTLGVRLQMNCNCKFFIEKHNTSRHYMWRFIAYLSAVQEDWVRREENQNCAARVYWQCRSVFTAILKNQCCRNKTDFITMFSNLTPLVGVNLDYKILEHVFAASTVQ